MTIEEVIRTAVREEVRAAFRDLAPSGKWDGMLKLQDAAKLVSVSVTTLEKWGRAGLRINRKGKVRVVDIAELKAFISARDVEPTVDAKEWAKQLLNVTPMRRAK